MGSASVALKKIILLYISAEKITVISAMPLRQPFENGSLEVFSNPDLDQIRILKTIQDQVPSNEVSYLGQGCISICIIKGGIWHFEVKKNLKKKKISFFLSFPLYMNLLFTKNKLNKHRIICYPFPFLLYFPSSLLCLGPNREGLSTHNAVLSTLEM